MGKESQPDDVGPLGRGRRFLEVRDNKGQLVLPSWWMEELLKRGGREWESSR